MFEKIKEEVKKMSEQTKNDEWNEEDAKKRWEEFVAANLKKYFGWVLWDSPEVLPEVTEADIKSLFKIVDLLDALSLYGTEACHRGLDEEDFTSYRMKTFESNLLNIGKSYCELRKDYNDTESIRKDIEMIDEEMDRLCMEQDLIEAAARCDLPEIVFDKSDPITRLDIKEAIEKVEEALAELSKYKTVLDDGTVKTIKP